MLENELWETLYFENRKGEKQYVISNLGRIASHSPDFSSMRLLSLSSSNGKPPRVKIAFKDGVKGFYVHKLVANHFLDKPKEATQLIHLDGNVLNNASANLKWVNDNEAMRRKKNVSHHLSFFYNEKYKLMDIQTAKRKYAITNYGRLISFAETIEDGYIINASSHADGYRIWRYKTDGKYFHHLIHRLVAAYFLPKPSPLHDFVIHLDHSKTNNYVSNLKWVTKEEQTRFGLESEASKASREHLRNRSQKTGKGHKLTEGRVRMIKRILNNPARKTRYKILAKRFGISEMQLYRIKSGENWGWVEI